MNASAENMIVEIRRLREEQRLTELECERATKRRDEANTALSTAMLQFLDYLDLPKPVTQDMTTATILESARQQIR